MRKTISKLKKELIVVFCLSAIQIWLNFTFPAFVRLGVPWNVIVGVVLSIVTVFFYFNLISTASIYAPYLNMEFFDEAPEPLSSILKNALKIGLITIAGIAMVGMWYKNFYDMSNTWYFVLYSYWIVAFLLMTWVVKRS